MIGLEVQTGSRGVFDVALDGETIFSKGQARRLPEDGEVAALLEARLGPPRQWRHGSTAV